MALLLSAISVCVKDCCSIGFEFIIILARALFTSAIDVRGGDGEEDDVICVAISSRTALDLLPCDLTVAMSISLLFSEAAISWTKRLSVDISFTSSSSNSTLSVLGERKPTVSTSSGCPETLSLIKSFVTGLSSLIFKFIFSSWLSSGCDSFTLSTFSLSLVPSTSGFVSLTSPQTSGSSASFSDLASSALSASSFDDDCLCVNRSLFRHLARLFWNQT